MKILLDESVPHRLRVALSEHEVHTTVYRGWGGLRNGDLITVAQAEYDILITADKNLASQQAISKLKLAVLVLPTNHRPTLMARVDDIRRALAASAPGRVTRMP